MDVSSLKQGVAAGTITVEQVLELLLPPIGVNRWLTSWKLVRDCCSRWLFPSALHTVLTFGCRKDAKTLDQMRPRDVFRGTAVSDDATVDQRRFDSAQKCWADQPIWDHPRSPDERDFSNLVQELFRVVEANEQCLGTGPVRSGARSQNRPREQNHRRAARRSVIQSVLEFLRKNRHFSLIPTVFSASFAN